MFISGVSDTAVVTLHLLNKLGVFLNMLRDVFPIDAGNQIVIRVAIIEGKYTREI